MAERIRIKDIAARAGVSVGTVDRVLHGRPNVSPAARAKVEKVLEEIDYKPNAYASALAYNKSYEFHVVMPEHKIDAYWDEIEEGVRGSEELKHEFHVSVKFIYYRRYEPETFTHAMRQSIDARPAGVIVVPTRIEDTRMHTDKLHELGIPFVLLDSYMPDLRPLSFFGQDSFASGYFAAKVLMMIASKEKEITILKPLHGRERESKQMANREEGFRHYMVDHYPAIKISELLVDRSMGRINGYDAQLDGFFLSHPNVHHLITFGSRGHIVGEFLLRTNRRNIQIMGYDMVEKNAECLKRGSMSFIIAQHAYMQGYHSLNALFNAVVLHKEVSPVNYMPIELLMKENVEFYRRMQV